MAKLYKVFEDRYDKYPLAITEADALLLQHEGLIIGTDDWIESQATSHTYTGLIGEGIARGSYLAKVPMEMIEQRIRQCEHVEADFFVD